MGKQRIEAGHSESKWLTGVDVVEQLIPDRNGVLSCLGDNRPAVELMWRGARGLVVPVEWREGTKGCPTRAKKRVGYAPVSADVRSNHGQLEKRRKLNELRDGDQIVRPVCKIVAKPVSDIPSCAGEG